MTNEIIDDDEFYSADDHPDAPSDRAFVVPDFLPPPDQLVMKDDNQKITIQLSRASIDFFKDEAERNGVSYQRMIRALLDEYVEKHSSK